MIPKEYRIATRIGFVEVFWEDLSDRRKAGEKTSHLDVFIDLENLYEDTFGRELFPSFDAFRFFRDQKHKK